MINFLIGRQTDPLQEKILEKAVEKYQQYPELKTFIIVPNHIKFTTEINAISKLAHNKNEQAAAVKNLQVLSFSRLAWYFLKDTSQSLPTQLDDAAAAMLLSKIISQRQSDLLLYKNTSINSGLVKQLYSTILEVHSGNLDLSEIDETHLDLETRSKVHDLRIIYEAFASEIADKFVTKDELQLKLNELLVNSDQLENANFYFSDFSHFSLQEKLTVKLIIKKALNVNFAFKTQIGKINSQPKEGDYDYVIQKTIGELLEFTKQKNLPYQLNFFPEMKRNKSIELNRLWTGEDKAKPANLDQVQLVKADSRYAEAYYVVHTIYQQVAFKNYRYRDFLVLAPNLQEYETYLQPILRQNEVPFFDDLQQQMKYHSLVILIENIAQLFAKPLQTQNLLAIMKTGLLIPQWYHDQDAYIYDIDKLENFVLAHGINHNLWRSDFKKFIDAKLINLDQMDERLAKINRLKDFFIQKLTTLIGNLQKETDTRKALTIFFDFFTTNGVTNQLEIWRENAIDKGDLQQAQQPEQVWQLLLTLLEDYLLINPKTFSAKDFFNMLVNGFKEATFSQIPSTLDAVNLSEMGMIQTNNYKQVFIIGATSTNLPAIQKTPSFFTSENLQQLAENFAPDSYLEDVQQTNNLDQNYQFGMSLALGKDRVYVSYPVLNTANEQLNPSIYYEQLKRWDAPEFSQHDLPEKTSDLLSFITNPQASLGYLAFLANKNKEVNGLLELTRQYLPEKTQAVIDGEKFNNQPEDIGLSLAQQLYGQNLNSSVSQLEKYYQNSFEYFLIYGLHLHKRFENEFDAIQAGNYFHETFDYLVKELNQQGLKLAEIDQLKLQKILQSVRQTIQNQAQYKQLLTDPFNQYLFRELDKTTDKVANNWHNSVKHTPLQPQYSELSFGLGEKIKGLNFTVPDLAGKHQVFLRGKIDRVDLMADSPAKELAQVIDYKSSAKKFNLSLFYNGISLQMISYLDVLTKNSSFFAGENGLDLLGAFYQTVTRKLARLNSKVMVGPDLQLKTQQYDTKPQLKYTGVMNNDPELLAKADPVLISGNSPDSAIYAGLGTRANGRFKLPVNSNFSKEELDLLLAYDEKLIKQAASEILSGKIKLNPYRYGKDNNALTYSDYRDIFFFDAKLNPNGYHEIATSLAKKELLSKIKEKLGTEND